MKEILRDKSLTLSNIPCEMLNSSDRLTLIFSVLFWRKYENLYFRNVYERVVATFPNKRKTRPLALAASTTLSYSARERFFRGLSRRQLPTVARGLTAPANNARQLPAPQMCGAGERSPNLPLHPDLHCFTFYHPRRKRLESPDCVNSLIVLGGGCY